MPRKEDRRSGKFVGLDGCGEKARGGAKRSAAPPCPRQDSRQIQGCYGCDPVAKGRMAAAPSLRQQRFRHCSRRRPGPCGSSKEDGKTIPAHWREPIDRHLQRGRKLRMRTPSMSHRRHGGPFARLIPDHHGNDVPSPQRPRTGSIFLLHSRTFYARHTNESIKIHKCGKPPLHTFIRRRIDTSLSRQGGVRKA